MAQDIGVTFHDLSSNVFEFLKVSSDCDLSDLRRKWAQLVSDGGDLGEDLDQRVLLCSGAEVPAEGSIQDLLAPGAFVLALQVERSSELCVQLAGPADKSVRVKVHPQKTAAAVLSDAKRSLGVRRDREGRLLFGTEVLKSGEPIPPHDDDQVAVLDLKVAVLVLDGEKFLPPLVEAAGELSLSGEWSFSGGEQCVSCFASQSATCLMQSGEPFHRQRLIETNSLRVVTEECRVGELLDDLEILNRRTAMAILEKQISLTVENLVSDETRTVDVWPSMKIGGIFSNADDVLFEGALLDKEKSFFEAGIAADASLTVSRMRLLEITDSTGQAHAIHVPHSATLAAVRERAQAFESHAFFKVSYGGTEVLCDSRPVSDLQQEGPIALKLFCLTRDVEVTYGDEVRLLVAVSEMANFEAFLQMVGEAFNEVLPPDAEFHCPCGRVFSGEVRQRRSFPVRCCDDQVLGLAVVFPSEQQPTAPPPPYESLDLPYVAPSSTPVAPSSVLPQIIKFMVAARGDLHFRDSSGRTLALLAAQEGSADTLRFLIDSGVNVGVARNDGVLPLHYAALHGHLEAVRLLLAHCRIDSATGDLRTPLHFAAQAGRMEVARELLQRGAAADARSQAGFSPLHHACLGGHAEVARVLTEYGCALNEPTNSGFAPLHCAAQNGHLQAALVLIQAGCDFSRTTVKGLTALHISVNGDHVAVGRALLEAGLGVNCRSEPSGFAPLHSAAYMGRLAAARLLLEAGADPNARTASGSAPLFFAVQRNHTAVAALLTSETKCDVNAQNDGGQSALHAAAAENRTEAARLLLDAGAQVDLAKKGGLTPLHAAAAAGHREVAQLLLDAGASPNLCSDQGSTPLHLAVQKGHPDMGRLLIAAGGDVNKSSLKGFAPLHQAVQWKSEDFVRLLLDSGADATLAASPTDFTPLHIAAEGNVEAIAGQLLAAGAAVDARSKLGTCPLHCAARKNSVAVVRLLIGAGCELDCALKDSLLTPLHGAATEGHAEVLAALLEAGADREALAKGGKTALHLAAEGGRAEAVRLLLEAGAEAAARSEEGATAEELAAAAGHAAVAKALRGGGGGPLSFLKAFKK